MSYKHRALQAQQAKSDRQSTMTYKSSAQKLATMLLTALPMFAVLGAGASLSGCGFQLRGYDAPMLFDVNKTAVIIEDNRTSFPIKTAPRQSLKSVRGRSY